MTPHMPESPVVFLTADQVLSMLQSQPGEHDRGPTITASLIRCARRVRLDAENPVDVLDQSAEARSVGIFTHKLVELYHSGLDPERLVARAVGHPVLDIWLEEAWRLFESYRAKFPAGWWGVSRGSELHLDDGALTSRIDNVWEMNDEVVRRAEGRFDIRLNGAGLYIWDLKTSKSRDTDFREKFMWEAQPWQNLTLLMKQGFTNRGWDPGQGIVRGWIPFQLIRYKTERQDRFQAAFYSVEEILSPENERRQLHLRQLAERYRELDLANPSSCFEFHRLCPHRLTSRCQGV